MYNIWLMINGEGPKSLRQIIFEKKKCRVMFQNVGSKRVTATLFVKLFFVDETSLLVPLLIPPIRFLISVMVLACSVESVFWEQGHTSIIMHNFLRSPWGFLLGVICNYPAKFQSDTSYSFFVIAAEKNNNNN